jgi:hypothetical protein
MAAVMSAPTGAVLDRAIEREDDRSLFLWLVEELERCEMQPEAVPATQPEKAARRLRGLRRAAAAVAARLDAD